MGSKKDLGDLIVELTGTRTFQELSKVAKVPAGTLRKISNKEYRPSEKTLSKLIPGLAKLDRDAVVKYLHSHLLNGSGIQVVAAA